MAARVPTLWGPSVTVGALALTYHACNLPLKTLALLGIGVSSGYLLVLDPNVLYTPHALSLIRPLHIETHTINSCNYHKKKLV